MGSVKLECPMCKMVMPDCTREDTDPPSAVRVVIICNLCDDGDFHEPRFFDAEGREVPWHEGHEQALDAQDNAALTPNPGARHDR